MPGDTQHPIRDDACSFCGRCCRVALSKSMPRVVVDAYAAARLHSMATCQEGSLAEHRRLGASYADVIAARITSLAAAQRAASQALGRVGEELRTQAEQIVEDSRRLRGEPQV